MAAIEVLDFQDIYTSVIEDFGGDVEETTVTLPKIKRYINRVYRQVASADRPWWLEKEITIKHKKPYTDGTASVTPQSTAVTISVAPAASLGSFVGYKFTTNEYDGVYTIDAHTAGGTSITLSAEYQGQLSSSVKYYIWRDRVDLPTDARETIDVYHYRHKKGMKGTGRRDYREIINSDPKAVGYPVYYRTADYYDPSTGDAETESDRYRQTLIHPSIMPNQENLELELVYVQEVTPLENDGDEPLLPVEYRDILVLGAAAMAYKNIVRDEETARDYQAMYEKRLRQLIGAQGDSKSNPVLGVKSRYLDRRRQTRMSRYGGFYEEGYPSVGGGGAHPEIKYLTGATINNPQLTGTIAANSSLVKDEDDMISDSATHLATQQSIKAYVDSRKIAFSGDIGSNDDVVLQETLNIEGGASIRTTITDNNIKFDHALRQTTVTYTDYSAAATSEAITLITLSENQVLKSLVLKTTTAFAGTGITAAEVKVGISGDTGKILFYYDVAAAVANTNFEVAQGPEPAFGGSKTILITLTTTGANIDQLTAGVLQVHYEIAELAS